MAVFEAFAFIALCCCVATVFDSYFKNKRRKPDQLLEKRLDNRLAQVEQLRERIEVLERIVTDHRFDLAREIDDLKDKEAG